MSSESRIPEGKSPVPLSKPQKTAELNADSESWVGAIVFLLVFVFIGIPIINFVVDIVFALSLSTIISLGILGYALHRRHERKQEAERKAREMARKKADWIKARMAEYDEYHARKDARSKEGLGENAAVAGAVGLAGASALNDALSQGKGAAADGGDAVHNIAAMDYMMRSEEQADHVSNSIRDMEMNRADFEARLDSEYTAWEAQNLAEDSDMVIGGTGSDGLL